MNTLSIKPFPRITRRIDLAEFAAFMVDQGVNEDGAAAVAEMLEGNFANVWLNHSVEFGRRRSKFNEMVADSESTRAQLLSESVKPPAERSDATIKTLMSVRRSQLSEIEEAGYKLDAEFWGVEPDDVRAVMSVSTELYKWINSTAWGYVAEYRDARKKNSGS